MSSQFDALARMYEESCRLPWRREMEAFSVFELLGDLEGRNVLDIGCGAGVYCRELALRRAAQVVGYDVSEGMIKHAVREEEQRPLGIRYSTKPSPKDVGAFDLALAVYVFPYADDYPALTAMCAVAAKALRPGGRFVTLPLHPEFCGDIDYYADYHMRLTMDGPRKDTALVELLLQFGSYNETITARYWSRPTIERALRETGFADIAWHDHQVSPRGLADHDEAYWAPYLARPHAALLEARKIGTRRPREEGTP